MPTPLDEQTLLRGAARAAQEWRVWLLPIRPAVLGALAAVGEPITNLPQPVALVTPLPTAPPIIDDAPSTITLEVAGDISLYPVEGTVAVSSGGRVGWLRYDGKLSSPPRFQNVVRVGGDLGAFAAGSTIDVRVLISDALTRVSIEESESYGGAEQPWLYDWRATVEGIDYDAARFPAEATFLVEARFYATGEGWSEWLLMARGVAAEGYGIDYDPATGARRWDGVVRSLSAYIERHITTARRYGQITLAPASVSASSTLGDPMPVLPEEFEHHAGNAQPGNVADGNPLTFWSSSNAPTRAGGLPTIPNIPGPSEGRLKINAVGIEPATGAGMLQWIELVVAAWPATSDNHHITIKHPADPTKSTIFVPSGSENWPGEAVDRYIPLPPGIQFIPPTHGGQLGLVLTNNAALFTERYGQPDLPLYDWRSIEVNGAYPGRLVELPLDTAGLMLRYAIPNLGIRGTDFVAYDEDGSADPEGWFIEHDWQQGSLPHWGTGAASIDPGVPLGGPGSAIRRSPPLNDSSRHTDWTIDPRPVPGDPGIVADDAWLVIDVPEFVVETVTAMSATAPGVGDALEVTDATPLDAAGEIMIGAERVAYHVSPTAPLTTLIVDERGAGGTAAAIHASGTRIYQYVPARNQATARESISRIELARPEGRPRLRVATIWAGDSGAVASGTNWHLSWYGGAPLQTLVVPPPVPATIVLNLAGWPYYSPANLRYDRLLLRIEEMQGGGRAILNEWRLRRTRANIAAGSEPGLGAVARALLEEVLEPEEIEIGDAFALAGGGQEATILGGGLMAALQELCETSLVTMRFTRDGRVAFAPAPHHPAHLPTPRLALGGDELSAQSERVNSRLAGAPVEVVIEDRATGAVTRARYPAAGGSGEPREIIIRSSAPASLPAAAIARALYIAATSRAHSMQATTAGLGPLITPGDWLHADSYGVASVPKRSSWRVAAVTHASDGPTELSLVEWRPHE